MFQFVKELGVAAKLPTPPGYEAFLRACTHTRLERADDVNLEEALRIYREHPDECLFHMRMTNGVFEWHLAQHPAWKAEFPEAAAHFVRK